MEAKYNIDEINLDDLETEIDIMCVSLKNISSVLKNIKANKAQQQYENEEHLISLACIGEH